EQAKQELESATQELETKMEEAKSDAEEEVFLIVEQMPKFEGGNIDTFRQWVQMRVQYPKELQEQGIGGRVVVSFEVNEAGEVTNVKTLATPDRRLSEIVENLVKQSPKWEPGRQRGQLVCVKYTLPIAFETL
ncbi:MAG: energy transducer TonB, partial [Alistipes sp.]|nr:energy transducer TonB [Alistipes sp.]